MTLMLPIISLHQAGLFALHRGSQPGRLWPSLYFRALGSLMNTGRWLAGPHPLPAIWVHTSLTEKCFALGDHTSSSFDPSSRLISSLLLAWPWKKQSDYGLDQRPGQETGIGDEMPSGLASNDCNFRNESSPTVPEGAGIRQSSTLRVSAQLPLPDPAGSTSLLSRCF